MISTAQLSMDNCSGLARGPTAASEPRGERGFSRESSQSSSGKRDVQGCSEASRASSATSLGGEGGGRMESHRPLVLRRTMIPVPPCTAPSRSCGCFHGCGNRTPLCWELQSGVRSGELWQSKMWQSCSLWNNLFGRDELAHIDVHSISQFLEHP